MDIMANIFAAEPEPPTESPTELLDLNDDCLIAIGRLLSQQDLSMFSSMCSRLNEVGRQVFVLDKANKALEIEERKRRGDDISYEYRGDACAPNFRLSKKEIQRYLRNFGDLIEKLTFDSFTFSRNGVDFDKVTEHVLRYSLFADVVAACSNGRLSDIQFDGVCWTPELTEMAQPLLCRLKKLRLRHCGGIDNILPKCNQLIELTAVDYSEPSNTRNIKLDADFPQLKFVKLVLHCQVDRIEAFLMRHRQLEVVYLPANFNWSVLANLHSIENIMTGSHSHRVLLGTYIDDTKYPVDQSEACFSKLKRVKLYGCSRLFQTFLSKLAGSGAFHSMEELKLRFYTFNGPTDTNVLSIIPNMRKLKELTVSNLNMLTIPMVSIQTTSNLTAFCVSHITIDDDFISGLRFLRQLKQLKIFASRMCVSEEAMEQLRHVTGLTELAIELFKDTPLNSAKWLLNLGSTRTLRKMHLQGFAMDDHFIIGLSQFTELKSLDVQPVFEVLRRHTEMLKQLHKLEDITLRFDRDDLDPEDFNSISLLQPPQFVNLRILSIHFGCQLDEKRIALLGKLQQVEELHLNKTYNSKALEFPWNSSSLVETMDNLKTLILNLDCEVEPFTKQRYMQFVEVCHRNKKYITIRLPNYFGIISFNKNDIKHHEYVHIVVDEWKTMKPEL